MGRTVFTNANLLDGEHPAKPDSTIVVDGDRIAMVATGSVAVQPGDRSVDCTGRTVMPGMVSGHFHSTYRGATAQLTPPLGFENPPAYQVLLAAFNVRLALECGVTSVVGANEAWDADPALRDAIRDGLLVGPRVVPGSRELITSADSNDTMPWWYDSRAVGGTLVCNGPDEFRRGVRQEIKRGAEVIKMFATGGHGVRLGADVTSITRDEFQAAVDAAHSLGKRVRAHVASKPAIMTCIEVGVDILDHADGLDEECIHACVETGTIVLPSILIPLRGLQYMGDTEFTSPRAQRFREMCEILPAAVEAGVLLCLGDDFGGHILPHGDYGHELVTYVQYASISPLEVLRWSSVNGGRLVGLDDLGRIEQGAIADVLVVDGDPSADITVMADPNNVKLVMRDGRLLVDKTAEPGLVDRVDPREVLGAGDSPQLE